VVLDPTALRETIHAIRHLVSEHFYLREMRDPELTVRTNRCAYVFPRQLAMYIARQLTGASLEEIGREFGGRHYSTVLHSINKIGATRCSDKALDHTITQLMEACVKPCA
jgi:chromosomal replication initiator protein